MLTSHSIHNRASSAQTYADYLDYSVIKSSLDCFQSRFSEFQRKTLWLNLYFNNRIFHFSRPPFLSLIKSQGQQHNHVNISETSRILAGNRDFQCPVCLQLASYPVETNCGHLFCAPCLISYWKHGSWLDAINCPLCRQVVNKMRHLFLENRSDCKEREILRHIWDYNKRYSGAPRQLKDYLYDAPQFLLLLVCWLGNLGSLVWLFLLRVALCGFGAAMTLASPLETLPGPLGSVLGILDDFVVVLLLLICVININQQMEPQRTGTRSVTHGVLTDTL